MNGYNERLAELADQAAAAGLTPGEFEQMIHEAGEEAERQRGQRVTLDTEAQRSIAANLLVESGAAPDDAAAWRHLAIHGVPAELGPAIERRKERIAAEEKARQDAAFAASPEGRKLAAQQAVEAREERQRLAVSARVLLEENAAHFGVDEETVRGLTDDEAMSLAGFTERENAADSHVSIEEQIVRGIPRNAEGTPMPRTQNEVRALDHINEGSES